jgi:TolB-like protein
MSEIFVSYARSTGADDAQRIAEALRAAGYEVWRDDELPPHRPFAEVLQERLEQAKAVLVLWSEEAVRSQWVCSEANKGREANKLVQVSLDGAAPPMPFDQIHCEPLEGWSGDPNAPGWRKVSRSISDLVGRPPTATDPSAAPPANASHLGRGGSGASALPIWRRRGPAWVAATIVALVVLGAGAWLLRDRIAPGGDAGALRIAVLPFDVQSPGQDVRFFADSLHDEIAGGLSESQIKPVSREASGALRGPNGRQALRRLGARLVLDGSARSDGDAMHVRVHVDDPQAQVTLWSREFDAPAKEASLLQSRVAHRMVVVLRCSHEALQPKGGLQDLGLLGRYLHACDVFADWDVHQGYDPQRYAEWLETMRALTARAPEFAPAQFTYATAAAISARSVTPEAAAMLRREADIHLKRGLALVPTSPEALAVRSRLAPESHWGERERLLRRSLATAPSWSEGNLWLGVLLVETGRVREGIEFSQRAAAGEQVYDWGIFYAVISCAGDRPERGITDVAGFQRLVPESLFAQDAQLFCLANARRWEDARALLGRIPDIPTPYRGKAAAAFFQAAGSRAPADLENARRLALASVGQGPLALPNAISSLSELGFVDDAFAVAQQYDPDAMPAVDVNIFMFSPLTRNLRRDPRFMQLAARIGLVDYWRSTGIWPDFCAEPGLPYDCKAVAKATASSR